MKKIKVPILDTTQLKPLFMASMSCHIMKEVTALLFLMSLTMGITSCNSENKNFTRDQGEAIDEQLTVIDMGKDFIEKDTFDCHQILGINYTVSDTLNLKIQTDATIISAEKVTHMYPTIWGDMDDELIQFVYLYDLGCEIKEDLPVSDGIIVYPVGTPSDKTETDKSFKTITQKQILDAIDNIPNEYGKRGHRLSYEYKNWTKEAKGWKKIANKYKSG